MRNDEANMFEEHQHINEYRNPTKPAKNSEDKPTKYCAQINDLAAKIFETQDAAERRKIIGEMNALKNKRAMLFGGKHA